MRPPLSRNEYVFIEIRQEQDEVLLVRQMAACLSCHPMRAYVYGDIPSSSHILTEHSKVLEPDNPWINKSYVVGKR